MVCLWKKEKEITYTNVGGADIGRSPISMWRILLFFLQNWRPWSLMVQSWVVVQVDIWLNMWQRKLPRTQACPKLRSNTYGFWRSNWSLKLQINSQKALADRFLGEKNVVWGARIPLSWGEWVTHVKHPMVKYKIDPLVVVRKSSMILTSNP